MKIYCPICNSELINYGGDADKFRACQEVFLTNHDYSTIGDNHEYFSLYTNDTIQVHLDHIHNQTLITISSDNQIESRRIINSIISLEKILLLL